MITGRRSRYGRRLLNLWDNISEGSVKIAEETVAYKIHYELHLSAGL
jgi:hypothetical protein